MPSIDAVTVYCSSSASVEPVYLRAAAELGTLLGSSGRRLVYGGGRLGLMGACAAACRDAGGHVTGIITERLRDAELLDPLNHENVVVDSMRERKRLLTERADAFVILPGGLGTLEEFFEVLVGRLLGEHDKPIALVNCPDPADPEPYYAPLLAMFEHMANNRFMNRGVMDLFDVRPDVRGVADLLEQWEHGQAAAAAGSASPRDAGERDRLLPGRLGR